MILLDGAIALGRRRWPERTLKMAYLPARVVCVPGGVTAAANNTQPPSTRQARHDSSISTQACHQRYEVRASEQRARATEQYKNIDFTPRPRAQRWSAQLAETEWVVIKFVIYSASVF